MPMATPSSLISSIHSVLHTRLSSDSIFKPDLLLALRMGLRNLEVLLVCLRNSKAYDMHVMQPLLLRIQDAIANIPSKRGGLLDDSLVEVNCLVKEVNGTVSNRRLTLDDVIEVADSILHNTADFWEVCWKVPNPATLRGDMDEVEVQTRFLRDFLIFVKGAGVENQQLQDLLIHIRPFVWDAARRFMIDATFCIGGSDWVEHVRSKCSRVDSQVFQAYTQVLLSIPTLDQIEDGVLEDFLSSLISLLWHALQYHSDSLKVLYESLRLCRSNLKQRRQNNSNVEYQIGALIRDAGILIFSVYLSGVDSTSLSDLLQRFDVVQAQVLLESNYVRGNVLEYGDATTMVEISDVKVQIDTAMASTQSSSASQVVGFQDDEVTSILNRIVRGSKQLCVVPVTGMVGLGKTTFALKVYNHRSVLDHFQARAWCTISQVFDMKSVLLHLLNQTQPGDYSGFSKDDLANKLRQSLKGKRYLIFFDDVWTPQVWESLRPSFQDDRNQSRIILTSRLHAIVPNEQPHFLRLRRDNECLEIIEMKLLHKAVGLSTELRKFAEMCKGLPLTAVLVAGLLTTTARDGWKAILDHLSFGGISGVEQCNIALELSYKQLPDYLKPCFIYFGVFPEDEDIYATQVIRLWMAEGFLTKKSDLFKKRIEDVAQEYLTNLIQRNLVTAEKMKSTGRVKVCRIHDMISV